MNISKSAGDDGRADVLTFMLSRTRLLICSSKCALGLKDLSYTDTDELRRSILPVWLHTGHCIYHHNLHNYFRDTDWTITQKPRSGTTIWILVFGRPIFFLFPNMNAVSTIDTATAGAITCDLDAKLAIVYSPRRLD